MATGCYADPAYPPQQDLPLQYSADHEAIMVDLALDDEGGHHDHGNNGKDNKTDLARGEHETDVTDTIVSARKGDMTDETLYLTSTARKDIFNDFGADLEGTVMIRKEHSRYHRITANGRLSQTRLTCRMDLHTIKVHPGL